MIFATICHWTHFLRLLLPLNINLHHFFNIYFNVLPFTSRSPKLYVLFTFKNKTLYALSLLPCMLNVPSIIIFLKSYHHIKKLCSWRHQTGACIEHFTFLDPLPSLSGSWCTSHPELLMSVGILYDEKVRCCEVDIRDASVTFQDKSVTGFFSSLKESLMFCFEVENFTNEYNELGEY